MAEKKFVPIGDHETDAFINQALQKKFPKLQDAAMADMEALRQEGIDTVAAPNPLTFILSGLHQRFTAGTGQEMPFEEFVSKFRDKIGKAMAKRKMKPFSVAVGPTKVVDPGGHQAAITSAQIVKALVSPLWDGAVGAMRVAGSPLADLPENQDPAQSEAVRRGLMQPLSEAERKKGQVEVLTGMLGVAGGGQLFTAIGSKGAGRAGLGGYLKNVLEGGAWGSAFGAAHGAGQELAAEEILEEAKSMGTGGAILTAGLGAVGAGIGKALRTTKAWKLDKLMADLDDERAIQAAHNAHMEVPDALAELLPDGGLSRQAAETSKRVRDAVVNARPYSPAPARALLPTTTEQFTNITIPDAVRSIIDPDKISFLRRADALLREKGISLDYETGQLTAMGQRGRGLPQAQIPASTTERLSSVAPTNVLPSGTATIHLPAGMEADAAQEISYRLTYGDKIFSEKSAEYDILPVEVKQKIDFWTYLDKTEGTPAAQFMRNMEKSAKTRLNNRASRRLGTAFDVTATPIEGAADLVDAAVIGAAKLYRLGHLAPEQALKVWNNEMVQVMGNTAASRSIMPKLYQASQKQLEKMVSNMAPEMHNVRNLMEKYEQGKAGLDWYTNAYAELEKIYGTEDARLMAHLLAINSTNTGVDDNVMFAMRDFARIKSGQAPLGGRFPSMQKKLIAQMLAGQPYGGQKVQNFVHTLLGGSGHATNDIQVARSLGWVRDKFSKNQYRFVDEVIRGLAGEAGVTTEQYQAALWTTPRIAKAQEIEMIRDAAKLWKNRRPQGNDELRLMANEYMKRAGEGELAVTATHPDLDPGFARKIAYAYDRMKSSPDDPAVRDAYKAFVEETKAQYDQLVEAGYEFKPFHGEDPYGVVSANVLKSLKDNKTLQVYADNLEHPLLTAEENWMFRAVHDTYGHGREGYQFGPKGENGAFLAHAQMYSEKALPAMVAETRGQNSWVNYYGDHQALPLKERPFAEQKVGLLPSWTYEDALALKRKPKRFATKSKPQVGSFRPYHELIRLRQKEAK